MAGPLGSAYVWGPHAGAAANIVTKEDVLDLVINIDPYDTPGVTLLPKTTCSSTLHEWVRDTLNPTATASGAPGSSSADLGAWPEGADFSERDVTTRTRVTNITQIFRKDIKVTNTMRALNPFGVADEYSYQIMKAAREVARNMEVALWRQTGSAGSVGSIVSGRLWKSYEGLLTTNAAFARGTFLSNSASNNTATSYPIRESDFNAMLDGIYRQGGDVDTVFVSPAVKRYISGWGLGTAATTGVDASVGARELQFSSQNARALTRRIDVYSSDFGDVQIVLNRWIPQSPQTTLTAAGTANMIGRMFFMERSRNRIAFLRPVRHVPLPPGGDAVRGMVVGEATLEALAENGSGLIQGVSPVGN